MNSNLNKGELFKDELLDEIKNKFYYVDYDPIADKRRIFFDNAGGSFRLKKANKAFKQLDELPDCPEHSNYSAKYLYDTQKKAEADIFTMLNVSSGSILTSLSASMVMFDMVKAIIENIPGENVVTTALEHPSSYDAVMTFAKNTNKEVRVAMPNPKTGGVDVEAILELVDEKTCLLSVMYASNISGAVFDLKKIVKEARLIKPDLYIICDAVQHMPHNWIDLQETPFDAVNFAPYKFFGSRGIGIGYMSERASKLRHNKLLNKKNSVWELGSPAPGHFGSISNIFNYVCTIGEKYISSMNRRELFVKGMEKINAHERALMNTMLEGTNSYDGLRKLDNVIVYLDDIDLSKRDFILAIGFNNIGYKDATLEYEKRGIIVFERLISSVYSKRMLEALNIPGAVRISPLHCNSKKDIEQFLATTKDISEL